MRISTNRSLDTGRVNHLMIRSERASDQILLTNLVQAMQSGKPFTIRIHEDHRTTSWISEQEVEELT